MTGFGALMSLPPEQRDMFLTQISSVFNPAQFGLTQEAVDALPGAGEGRVMTPDPSTPPVAPTAAPAPGSPPAVVPPPEPAATPDASTMDNLSRLLAGGGQSLAALTAPPKPSSFLGRPRLFWVTQPMWTRLSTRRSF